MAGPEADGDRLAGRPRRLPPLRPGTGTVERRPGRPVHIHVARGDGGDERHRAVDNRAGKPGGFD